MAIMYKTWEGNILKKGVGLVKHDSDAWSCDRLLKLNTIGDLSCDI